MKRIFYHPLFKNATALYAAHAMNYLVPLIAIPYLARVLRPNALGMLVFAQAFAFWLGMLIEYGFGLSATRDVAANKEDLNQLARVASGVVGAKLLLVMGVLGVCQLAFFALPTFREHPAYLGLALVLIVGQGFSPLWYFQGVERMAIPNWIDTGLRIATLGLIFVLVSTPEDAWKVLALQAGCAVLSACCGLCLLYREVPFHWPQIQDALGALKSGWDVFVFQGSSSFYTAANSILVGLFLPPAAVAFYGGAERISRGFVGLTAPAFKILYPRMNVLVHTNAGQAANVMRWCLPVVLISTTLAAAAVYALAPLLVLVLLGPAYSPTVPVLRLMTPLIPLIGFSNLVGVQWLLPFGLERLLIRTILSAGAINIGLASVFVPCFGVIGMAGAVVCAELFVASALGVLMRRTYNFSGLRRMD